MTLRWWAMLPGLLTAGCSERPDPIEPGVPVEIGRADEALVVDAVRRVVGNSYAPVTRTAAVGMQGGVIVVCGYVGVPDGGAVERPFHGALLDRDGRRAFYTGKSVPTPAYGNATLSLCRAEGVAI